MNCVKENGNNQFLLLYGSQTGQAKAIAEEIADTAPNFGLVARLHCLSQTEKKFSIREETCIVFVVSTTGNGEPPDTAIKFFRRINKRTLNSDYLQKLNYALLAIGDSNYTKFCYFGKQLDKRLQALSAKHICNTGYGDDAYGIETGVDPWLYQLWPALKRHFGLEVVISSLEIVMSETRHICDLVLDCMKNSIVPHNHSLTGGASDYCAANSEEVYTECDNLTIYNIISAAKIIKKTVITMPNLPDPYLSVCFLEGKIEGSYVPSDAHLIAASSDFVEVELVSTKRLTKTTANVKKVLEMTFKFKNDKLQYLPGDSFGFSCCNAVEEVQTLLKCLGLENLIHAPCQISLLETSKGKKKLPSHIPRSSSLAQLFTYFVDIRSVPKKVLLRILSKYCRNDDDRVCLQFLSSQEGTTLFTEYIRKPSLSVLDILQAFRSCVPPVERLLEHLPVLKPRFYSLSCSPLEKPDHFTIVFSVFELKRGSGRYNNRKGVCTGWLDRISTKTQKEDAELTTEITNDLSSMSLNEEILYNSFSSIYVYKRKNQHFILPDDDDEIPLIMVGPGTGVAPFIGFLKHRELKMCNNEKSKHYGETWLFYGCRYCDKDFLYKDELHRFQSRNVLTHLIVSFSRDKVASSTEQQPRYVQDNIQQYAVNIINALDLGAKVYVCGDAKNMAKDVFQAFINAYQSAKKCPMDEASAYIKALVDQKRYFTDVWT